MCLGVSREGGLPPWCAWCGEYVLRSSQRSCPGRGPCGHSSAGSPCTSRPHASCAQRQCRLPSARSLPHSGVGMRPPHGTWRETETTVGKPDPGRLEHGPGSAGKILLFFSFFSSTVVIWAYSSHFKTISTFNFSETFFIFIKHFKITFPRGVYAAGMFLPKMQPLYVTSCL